MKATLSFDLSDPDDRQAHLRSVKSTHMAAVLWELVHNTHKKLERLADQKEKMSPYEMLDEFYLEFHSLMEANGIDIDDLY